jgi:hypothetical protein
MHAALWVLHMGSSSREACCLALCNPVFFYHTADASAVLPREGCVVQVKEITSDHATVKTHSGELTFTLYL